MPSTKPWEITSFRLIPIIQGATHAVARPAPTAVWVSSSDATAALSAAPTIPNAALPDRSPCRVTATTKRTHSYWSRNCWALTLQPACRSRSAACQPAFRRSAEHPESGDVITAGIGRYGPYIKHGSTYVSLPPDEDVLTIGLNRAVTLIAEAPARKRGGSGKPLGDRSCGLMKP